MSAPLAFVFPGQGSQSLGMLGELAAQQASILDTFAEASEALGYDLWSLTQQGPEALLNQTDKTQPAILTASVALWRLWQIQDGRQPDYVAGHSLGEYSALVAAGALTLARSLARSCRGRCPGLVWRGLRLEKLPARRWPRAPRRAGRRR